MASSMFEGFSFILEQLGERAVEGASKAMREGAEYMAEMARSNAPRDTGTLETAIEVIDESIDKKGNRKRVNGRFAKSKYVVWVNPNTRNEHHVRNGDSMFVRDYAFIMESSLENGGSGKYRLGKRSQEKFAEGNNVGGGYMRRAYEENADDVRAFVKQSVAQELKLNVGKYYRQAGGLKTPFGKNAYLQWQRRNK